MSTTGDGPPRLVHADEAIVVVDKPSGMPSVPARTPLDPPDVARMLATRFGPLEAAHRLDRDTSGLLVLARTRAARAALGRSFERREVAKRYLAVVIGSPTAVAGELTLPLAADRDHPPRQRIDERHGRPAATRWRLLATLVDENTDRGGTSLLEVEPLTGRSHQIRVHLAALGCPIAGDRLYGGDAAGVRLALHAAHLELPHPASGDRLVLAAVPPPDPPWDRYGPVVRAAMAAWPTARPSASTARTGPDR